MPSEAASLRAEAQAKASRRDWGHASNAYAELADLLWKQGSRRAAVRYYFVKAIIGLQGGTNSPHQPLRGSSLSDEEFETDFAFVGSDVWTAVRVYLEDEDASTADLRQIYDEAVEEVWRDRFPRSRDEVWAVLEQKINTIGGKEQSEPKNDEPNAELDCSSSPEDSDTPMPSNSNLNAELDSSEESSGPAWYDRGWVVALLVVFFWPLALYAVLKSDRWDSPVKYTAYAIGALVALSVLVALFSDPEETETASASSQEEQSASLIDKGSPTAPDWHPVDSTAVEGMWPFTAAEGEIGCVVDTEPEIAGDATNEVTVPLFRTPGTTYALVGHGWTQMKYADPDAIRRSHPQYDGMLVSLGDMQDRAEKLCGKTHQSQ